MSDLTFGMRLTYDGKTATAGMEETRASMDRVTATSNKMASQYSATAMSANQLRQATRQLPMQFTDIVTSLASGQSPMMVMIQQGGQLKDTFGGVGAASKAMGGYIMGLLNPVSLATGAVVAAGAAWYAWGRDAESAADKVVAASKKATEGMRSTDALYLLQREREKLSRKIPIQWLSYDDKDIQKLDEDSQKLIAEYRRLDKQLKAEIKRSGGAWDAFYITGPEKKDAQIKELKQLYEEQVVAAQGNKEKLLTLERQYQQKKAEIEKAFSKKDSADDREAEKLRMQADAMGEVSARWSHLNELLKQGKISSAEMEYALEHTGKTGEKAAEKSSKAWETFADNTQRTMSDVLYDDMNGKFNIIEDAFKQMLFRMAANAAAAKLTESLFGTGKGGDKGLAGTALSALFNADGNAFGSSGVVPFANGGAFGDGMILDRPTPFLFANGGTFGMGVAGEAGYEGALPLKRMSNNKLGVYAEVGGRGSQAVEYHDHTTIHIDSRADRAQILSDVSRLIDNKQAQFRERMKRGTA